MRISKLTLITSQEHSALDQPSHFLLIRRRVKWEGSYIKMTVHAWSFAILTRALFTAIDILTVKWLIYIFGHLCFYTYHITSFNFFLLWIGSLDLFDHKIEEILIPRWMSMENHDPWFQSFRFLRNQIRFFSILSKNENMKSIVIDFFWNHADPISSK